MRELVPEQVRRTRRGQSVVELALLLPILLLIVLGILDLGRSFYSYVSITNAAREGARYASLNPGAGQEAVAAHVIQELGAGVEVNSDDVTVTHPAATPGQPERVEVRVDCRFDLVVASFWASALGWPDHLTLTSTAFMPVTGGSS